MKNICNLILIMFAVIACSPEAQRNRQEQKIARLLKKNPQLIDTDTVNKEIEVVTPEICDTANVILSQDSLSVDSLIGQFEGKVDGDILDSLKDGFNDILKHSGDIDTIVKTKKTTFRIKKKGSELTIESVTNPSKVKTIVPVSVTTIKVPEIELRWYEEVFKWMRGTLNKIIWSLFFLFVLYIVYRVIRFGLKRL